jgi:hypothetical protein
MKINQIIQTLQPDGSLKCTCLVVASIAKGVYLLTLQKGDLVSQSKIVIE